MSLIIFISAGVTCERMSFNFSNCWFFCSSLLSGMGSGALNGMADGFMSGAITGAITGAASGIKTLRSTNQLGSNINSCGSSDCFVAGTKILTEHGKKNIEDIKVGDRVWSWNESINKQELKKVVQLFRNRKRDMVYITVDGEKITTTTEHPFYVKGKGWVRAKNLLDTDVLVCYNGNELKIESVRVEYAESAVQTYNFEVEGNHNYYVSETSILAHNFCAKTNAVEKVDISNGHEGYKQGSGPYKGKIISPDTAGHGGAATNKSGSAFKLYKELAGNKVKLIGDLDVNGILISGKHSSNLNKIFRIVGRSHIF